MSLHTKTSASAEHLMSPSAIPDDFYRLSENSLSSVAGDTPDATASTNTSSLRMVPLLNFVSAAHGIVEKRGTSNVIKEVSTTETDKVSDPLGGDISTSSSSRRFENSDFNLACSVYTQANLISSRSALVPNSQSTRQHRATIDFDLPRSMQMLLSPKESIDAEYLKLLIDRSQAQLMLKSTSPYSGMCGSSALTRLSTINSGKGSGRGSTRTPETSRTAALQAGQTLTVYETLLKKTYTLTPPMARLARFFLDIRIDSLVENASYSRAELLDLGRHTTPRPLPSAASRNNSSFHSSFADNQPGSARNRLPAGQDSQVWSSRRQSAARLSPRSAVSASASAQVQAQCPPPRGPLSRELLYNLPVPLENCWFFRFLENGCFRSPVNYSAATLRTRMCSYTALACGVARADLRMHYYVVGDHARDPILVIQDFYQTPHMILPLLNHLAASSPPHCVYCIDMFMLSRLVLDEVMMCLLDFIFRVILHPKLVLLRAKRVSYASSISPPCNLSLVGQGSGANIALKLAAITKVVPNRQLYCTDVGFDFMPQQENDLFAANSEPNKNFLDAYVMQPRSRKQQQRMAREMEEYKHRNHLDDDTKIFFVKPSKNALYVQEKLAALVNKSAQVNIKSIVLLNPLMPSFLPRLNCLCNKSLQLFTKSNPILKVMPRSALHRLLMEGIPALCYLCPLGLIQHYAACAACLPREYYTSQFSLSQINACNDPAVIMGETSRRLEYDVVDVYNSIDDSREHNLSVSIFIGSENPYISERDMFRINQLTEQSSNVFTRSIPGCGHDGLNTCMDIISKFV